MNKAALALKISERLDLPKKTAEDFIHVFQDIVTETLAADQEVTIAGFGTFSSRIRAARKGVNPRNPSQTINVPAVKVPKFKAGKALKDSLKASMNDGAGPKETNIPKQPAPEAAAKPAVPNRPQDEQKPQEAQAPRRDEDTQFGRLAS